MQLASGKKIVFFAALLAAAFLLPQRVHAQASGAGNIGWVTSITGEARVTRTGEKPEKTAAARGMEIFLNDTIETSAASRVTIQFEDESAVSIAPNAKLTIAKWMYDPAGKKNASGFKLAAGGARGVLKNLFGDASLMEFETSDAVAGVKGSDISVWIEQDGSTVAAVSEGKGFLRHLDPAFLGQTIELTAGTMGRAVKGIAIDAPIAITKEIKERIEWLPILIEKEFIEGLKKFKFAADTILDKTGINGAKNRIVDAITAPPAEDAVKGAEPEKESGGEPENEPEKEPVKEPENP